MAIQDLWMCVSVAFAYSCECNSNLWRCWNVHLEFLANFGVFLSFQFSSLWKLQGCQRKLGLETLIRGLCGSYGGCFYPKRSRSRVLQKTLRVMPQFAMFMWLWTPFQHVGFRVEVCRQIILLRCRTLFPQISLLCNFPSTKSFLLNALSVAESYLSFQSFSVRILKSLLQKKRAEITITITIQYYWFLSFFCQLWLYVELHLVGV